MSFTLDGFEIGDSIGSGGFGEVFAARQIGVDRPVAIKVGHMALADTKDQLRFERECKALGRLSTHPNIATVHTSGTLPDGRPYLVLEYVDGGDLLGWASSNRATEAEIISIGTDLASAVAEAHRNDIIHRDLKPENLMLRTNGQAVLGDFGIAQMQDGLRTATGNVTASVAYAAPEILGGARATPSADVYGIGICLLVAATGTVPFTEPTDESLHPVLTRVLTSPPPQLTDYGHSAKLNDLVQRLLSKEPADRPPSAEAVEQELRSLNGSSASASRPSPQSTISRIPVAQLPTEAVSQTPPAPPLSPPPLAPPAFASPPQTPAPAVAPVTAASTTPVPTPGQQEPNRKLSPAMIAAVAVGAVALLAIIGYLLIQGGGEPEEVATASDPVAGTSSEESDAPTTTAEKATASTEPGVEPEEGESTASTATPPTTSAPIIFDATDPIPISDNFAVALDFREYDIELEAGQSIAVKVDSMNDSCDRDKRIDLHVAFFGPGSTEIGSEEWPGNSGCAAFGGPDWTAAAAGVHTVRVRVGDGVSFAPTGSFEAVIYALEGRTQQIDVSSPFAIDGAITIPRDRTEYTFPLEVGDRVTVEVDTINGKCDRAQFWDFETFVTDPAGELMTARNVVGEEFSEVYWLGNEGCGAYGYFEATIPGVHTVVFQARDGGVLGGDVVGTFEATIARSTESFETFDLSEPARLAGEILTPRSANAWVTEFEAGDRFSLEVTSLNGGCEDRLDFTFLFRGPDGNEFHGRENFPFTGCGVLGPFEATEAGEHAIIVDGGPSITIYGDRGRVGAYEFTIGKLGG